MTKVTLTYPTVGQKDSTEEPKVTTALQALETFLNGQKIESTDNIKPEGIAEASLSAPVQTLLNTKSAAALTLAKKNEATFTAASGELVFMEKAASTLTLPEPTANRIIGVFASSDGIKVKCTKVATEINGDFTHAKEIVLSTLQHVLLQADGTNWAILAGEPKREQVYAEKSYTKVESEAGVEPSATRLAFVVFSSTFGLSIGGVSVTVGGTSFLIPPGQKWKSTAAQTTVTLLL